MLEKSLYLLEEEYNDLVLKHKRLSWELIEELKSHDEESRVLKTDSTAKAFAEEQISIRNKTIESIKNILNKSVVVPKERILSDKERVCKIWKSVKILYEDGKEEIVNICWVRPIDKEGNISYISPLARAIVWKTIWDEFYFEVSGKIISWEILSIDNMKI